MRRKVLQQVLIWSVITLIVCAFGKVIAQDQFKIIQVDAAAFPEISVRVSSLITPGGNLTRELFQIQENGISAPILKFDSQLGSRVIDVAIVFDETGSMVEEIQTLKTTSIYLAESLARAKLDYQLSLITFRNQVEKAYTFTRDAAEFQSWVNSMGNLDGTDEASMEALLRCLQMGFRKNADKRVIVLITDEPPFHPELQGQVLQGLRNSRITLYAISPELPVYQGLTNSSGGALFNIAAGDFNELVRNVIDMIVGNSQLVYRSPNLMQDGSRRVVQVSFSSATATAEYLAPQAAERPPSLIWDPDIKDEFGQDENLRHSGKIILQGWSQPRIQTYANELNFILLGPGGEQVNSADSPAKFEIDKTQEEGVLSFTVSYHGSKKQGSYYLVVNHQIEELGKRRLTVVDPLFIYTLYKTIGDTQEETFKSNGGSSTVSKPLFQDDVIYLVIEPTYRFFRLSSELGSPPIVELEAGTDQERVELTPDGRRWKSKPVPLKKTGNYRLTSKATMPGGSLADFELNFQVEQINFALKWVSQLKDPIYHGQILKGPQGAIIFQGGAMADWSATIKQYDLIFEVWPESGEQPRESGTLSIWHSGNGFIFTAPLPTTEPGKYTLVVKMARKDTEEAAQSLELTYEVRMSPLHIIILDSKSKDILIDSRNETGEVSLWSRKDLLMQATVDLPYYQIRSSLAKFVDQNGNELVSRPLSWKEGNTFEGTINCPESLDNYSLSIVTELEASPGAPAGTVAFTVEFRYPFSIRSLLPPFLLGMGMLAVIAGGYYFKRSKDVNGIPKLAGSIIIRSKSAAEQIDLASRVKSSFARSVKIGFSRKYEIPIDAPEAKNYPNAGFELGFHKHASRPGGYQLYLKGIKDSHIFYYQHGTDENQLRDGVVTAVRNEITGRRIEVHLAETTIIIDLAEPEEERGRKAGEER